MAQAVSSSSRRPVVTDQPVMAGETGERDLEHDLGGALRPAVRLLGLLEAFQLATNVDEDAADLGPTASSARMTRSLAAITSSRRLAALKDEPRRERSDGASADQLAVTRGLIPANQ
jgi:hypothetical protein